MTTSKFHCEFGTTDASCPLGLEIWLDHCMLLDQNHVTQTQTFEHAVADDDCGHLLEFVIKNKTAQHTIIDTQGQIIKDACLTLKKISFDDIELNQLFVQHARYRHNFNGHGDWQDDVFFETLGCNGTVKFEFSTPIYLWLLEHM
jgi:hypothetical protein